MPNTRGAEGSGALPACPIPQPPSEVMPASACSAPFPHPLASVAPSQVPVAPTPSPPQPALYDVIARRHRRAAFAQRCV